MRSVMYLNLLAVVVMACTASCVSAQFAPSVPAPPDSPLPLPVVPPLQPMTVAEFAATFKPLPGKYEVLLIHPKTGCPVKVCFTLPPGCIRKVRVSGHRIVFDYKCQCNVVIRFLHGGKVWVRG